MFLSRLFLNVKDRQVRSELARPYDMHRTICTRGFGSIEKNGLGRILFRVDTDRQRGKPLLLVQSDDVPDWSKLPAGYLIPSTEAEWKEFSPHFTVGQRLQFRLRANPTKRVAAKNERLGGVMLGKRIGLTSETDQLRWLLRKGEGGGFLIPGGWVPAKHPETLERLELPNFRVELISEGRDRNDKLGHSKGVFLAVRFDGVLEVTEPNAFVETLHNGLGSAKGFGFGLLSVAPIKF